MKTVDCFDLQPTTSFPGGAPQREEYADDASYREAVLAYASSWRSEYRCLGCRVGGCPQCSLAGGRRGRRG